MVAVDLQEPISTSYLQKRDFSKQSNFFYVLKFPIKYFWLHLFDHYSMPNNPNRTTESTVNMVKSFSIIYNRR